MAWASRHSGSRSLAAQALIPNRDRVERAKYMLSKVDRKDLDGWGRQNAVSITLVNIALKRCKDSWHSRYLSTGLSPYPSSTLPLLGTESYGGA